MDDVIAGVAGGTASGGLTRRILSRRSRKNKTQNVLECAFRDRTGATSKLLKRWRHGRATLEPGVITFVPFVALGLRFKRPFIQPILLRVVSVSSESRDNTKSEAWFFQGSIRLLQTDQNEIEWGISHLDDPACAISAVAPSSTKP